MTRIIACLLGLASLVAAQTVAFTPPTICVGESSVFTATAPPGNVICLMVGTGGAGGSTSYDGIGGQFALEPPFVVYGEFTSDLTVPIDMSPFDTGFYIHAQAVILNLRTGAFTFTNAATLTAVSAEWGDGGGGPLPFPYRVGITAHGHDRTDSLQVTIAPAAEAAAVTLTGDAGIAISNVTSASGTISFDIVGVTPSESVLDQTLQAVHATAGVCGETYVTVVVPREIATPYPQFSGNVDGVNRLLDRTTTPVFLTPPGMVLPCTVYGTSQSITVLDQFSEGIGDLYEGADVEEFFIGFGWIDINVDLGSGSSYPDAVGFVVFSGGAPMPVDPMSPLAQGWLTGPVLPPPAATIPTDVPVAIDGFELEPGIENRDLTSMPVDADTALLTIVWPTP